MNNKKIAVIIVIFVIAILLIIGALSIFSHIPLLGKAAGLFIAVLLVAFVITFFAVAGRKK